MLSDKIINFTQAQMLYRRKYLCRLPEIPTIGQEERELLDFLLATLPVTDLGDYSVELLLSHVRHALRVREEFSWCAELPERLFLLYVLCPRVNNEQLSDSRGLFYGELRERVKGLSLTDAILEVNRWCAEHVTYRSTDDRTASALDIYGCGYGRCGEESVFAVNALRSVGIAARQVYAPRWSHCDDNHAWVEAFDGQNWRYLGACEPEPRLDMGWFTAAAGRAMLCHTKAFVGADSVPECLFPGAEPLDVYCHSGVAYESVTARYGKVKPLTVTVSGPNGPVMDARVDLYILNYGGLCKIAQRSTDISGGAALNLGQGSVWVTAYKNGLRAEALVDTNGTSRLDLTLAAPIMTQDPVDFDFIAPKDSGIVTPQLTDCEKSQRRGVLENARNLREARTPYRGDYSSTYAPILSTFTEKDRAGHIDPQVLAECPAADDKALELYSPRVGPEPLMPWRQELSKVLPGLTPVEIWEWLCANTDILESFTELPQTPSGAWRLQAATRDGLRTLFCAICRARGVPARLTLEGGAEYWQGGRYHSVDGAKRVSFTLKMPEGAANLCLMRFDPEQGWVPLPPDARELSNGDYRMMTSVRLPNGDQLGRYQDICLEEGAVLCPEFRRADGQGLMQRMALPPLGFDYKGVSLLIWAEPREEPTEHLFGELREAWPKLSQLGVQVHICCKAPEKLSIASDNLILHPWDGDVAEAVSRRVYLEPGRLPLVVLADAEGVGRYACAGYNVGSVELIAGLGLRLAEDNCRTKVE